MIDSNLDILEGANLYSQFGDERCGFILENSQLVEVNNISNDKQNGFMISADDIIEHVENQNAVATWHTHPNDIANLSFEDSQFMRDWADLTHYILGSDGIRAYKYDDRTQCLICTGVRVLKW